MFTTATGEALAPCFVAPRVRGLAVAPDGDRYALEIDTMTSSGGRLPPAVWLGRIGTPPRPAFVGRQVTLLSGGVALYRARSVERPGRDALWRRDETAAAEEIAAPPGGVAGYRAATRSGVVVYATRTPHSADAVLFDGGQPVGSLRGDGGGRPRLVLLRPGCEPTALPDPPDGVLDGAFDLSADGTRIVATCRLRGGTAYRTVLLVAECDRHDRWRWRTVLDDPEGSFAHPVLSPDGRRIVCMRGDSGRRRSGNNAGTPPDTALWIADLDPPGGARRVAAELECRAGEAAWSPDGERLYVCADRCGNRPVYEITVDGGYRRLTAVGAFEQVAAAGDAVYALRSALDSPPAPVVIRASAVPGRRGPYPLGMPAAAGRPGTLERVSVVTEDGHRVHGWLCRPPSTGRKVPLQVWLHGGPYASWAAWSWRWNPWLAVRRGYAVLLPDPAPSIGYGRAFRRRAWGDWSGAPRTDVLSIVAEVRGRPGIDASRVAVLGSSFGGFLVNLLVTRSDAFQAAVSHAGMWDLAAFASGSVVAAPFIAEFGHPVDPAGAGYAAHSPRTGAAAVRTPILVSHGSRDDKVPYTEALAQYADLCHLGKPVRLLLLSDEGHEIARAANVQLWYECVFAFLAHVLDGVPFEVPGPLRRA
ncbi:peptidase S9 [Asanoa ishikariensis]|uniref:Dipeptidyl aminopeptidase/acylaminoacyl peptidase n=1 Tax=Asanoa ishikariensis TaxID=137265 RepID=A0A1H3U9N7_9ACTN|nr:prolyl oligopeptidase family serine peptidase [Asanoa ishikariensis]GIF64116.1 peptidase S9 [Asanoa ishikariensis]SDZ58525.1 Dipeptidyl aminopeptidase/acylaminoacyl peptidase [Asanoa ishikariensis]